MRVLFAAHGKRDATGRIPGTGFLHDMTAVLEDLGLTLDLIVDGVFDSLEGVDVLHLGTGAEGIGADRAQGHVEVRAQVALLHAAVGDVDVLHDSLDLFHVDAGFLSGGHVRLGDDLEEWHAGTVVVDVGGSGVFDGRAGVNQLTSIFLHVDTGQTDTFLLAIHIDVYPAMLDDWQVILGRLPVLRQVRIVVVLAVELAVFVDGAIRRETCLDGKLDDALVDGRQYARQAQADRADMRVLLSAESRGTAAEDFRFGFQFAVYFKTDYGFVLHQLLPPSLAISLWKSWLCS